MKLIVFTINMLLLKTNIKRPLKIIFIMNQDLLKIILDNKSKLTNLLLKDNNQNQLIMNLMHPDKTNLIKLLQDKMNPTRMITTIKEKNLNFLLNNNLLQSNI